MMMGAGILVLLVLFLIVGGVVGLLVFLLNRNKGSDAGRYDLNDPEDRP
ncbi:MAG: hypothetical protein AAFX86_04950 [Pseudomonadota bacterium]